jgi:hypothetical protein
LKISQTSFCSAQPHLSALPRSSTMAPTCRACIT